MLSLDLTNAPRWHYLAPGVRVQLRPLTTALMVATRNDPAVEAMREDASDEERAVAFAKALARRAVLAAGGHRRCGRQHHRSEPGGHRRAARHLADLRGVPAELRLEGPAAGAGKKRLRALAEWSFGGGDRYCQACAEACEDCPARLNQPITFEGWQVWDLVGRLGSQLRVLPGAVIGWDMSAALALGDALGVPPSSWPNCCPSSRR